MLAFVTCTCCRAPYYDPPEALDGCKPDMASNVYALGMLAYELLLRKEPYQDEDQGVLPKAIAFHELGLHSKPLKFVLQIISE